MRLAGPIQSPCRAASNFAFQAQCIPPAQPVVLIFFGAFCVCFGEKVLLIEQKNFLCFHKGRKQRCFLQSDRKPTMIKLLKLNCGTERLLYQMSSSRPFFLLSLFRSLPTGFFYAAILPTESQAFTAISSPRQSKSARRSNRNYFQ